MAGLRRTLKQRGKRALRQLFEIGQRFGVDILPHHFYSQIPNIQNLRKENYWRQPRSMIGINGSEIEKQMAFVKQCCSLSLQDRLKRGDIHAYACSENGEPGFGMVEAEFLFCFMHTFRPKRIVQIGCGVSTAVMILASKEADYKVDMVCIDPYPSEFLRRLACKNEIELLPQEAQKVPLDVLVNLGGDGMLFIDSTHAVKPGSEVSLIMLEVLPRLSAGNHVHFHDICFPYDYQRGILAEDVFFSNETVLLHAFLINNPKYRLNASLSMLQYARPDELQRYLPNYKPSPSEWGMERPDGQGHFPSSTYLEVI